MEILDPAILFGPVHDWKTGEVREYQGLTGDLARDAWKTDSLAVEFFGWRILDSYESMSQYAALKRRNRMAMDLGTSSTGPE